jgi:Zn-dependent protease with chaperone function
MSLFVAAGLLAAFSLLLIGPASVRLAEAGWVSRAPRAAVVLWQSMGVSAMVAAIGAGLCLAVERFHAGFLNGLGDLLAGLVDGHPLRGLGLPDALGLTLAADLGVVLVVLIGTTMGRTVAARAHHRHLLTLLAGGTPTHPGLVLLDHPQAVAYCLPGFRPRIVISTGTQRALSDQELHAVIAHERGHAREHHGLIMLPMAPLTDLFAWIPYARLAPTCVAGLLEMAADDHAVRQHQPAALASALVQMATLAGSAGGTNVPCCAFGATAVGVPARVDRLLNPGRSSRRTAAYSGLAAVAIVTLPAVALLLS